MVGEEEGKDARKGIITHRISFPLSQVTFGDLNGVGLIDKGL